MRLGLRLDTGVGMSIFDVAVGIRVCGWVRLGGHDPGEGREGRVDKERRMGAAGACIAHVNLLLLFKYGVRVREVKTMVEERELK